jgi:hypothetical protein
VGIDVEKGTKGTQIRVPLHPLWFPPVALTLLEWRERRGSTRDLCRDSTEAGSNLLKLSATDGFFWRPETPMGTVIGPLFDPQPLPCKPLPRS